MLKFPVTVKTAFKPLAARVIPLPTTFASAIRTVRDYAPRGPDIVDWMQECEASMILSEIYSVTGPADVLSGSGDGYIPGVNTGSYSIRGSGAKAGVRSCPVLKDRTTIGSIPSGGRAWLDGMNLLGFFLSAWRIQTAQLLQWFRSHAKLGPTGYSGSWRVPTYHGNITPTQGLADSAVFSYTLPPVPIPLMTTVCELTVDSEASRKVKTILRDTAGVVSGETETELEGSRDYTITSTFVGVIPPGGFIEVFPSFMPKGCTLTRLVMMPPPIG